MYDPDLSRPDVCSIHAAAEKAEFAEAARGVLDADGCPLADNDLPLPGRDRRPSPSPPPTDGRRTMTVFAAAADGYRANATSSVDRAIRLSTAAAVLAVAGIAAYVSYWHAYAVVRAHGESGITARLEPATIDGLVYASSMVVLYATRHRLPVPSLARWLLGLGIAATLTANMAQGWSHGPVGAVVAAWPAVSLVGSYELLVWLIRTSGTVEHRPPAGHLGDAAACRIAARSATTAPTGAKFPRRGERGTSDQQRQPAAQLAGPPAIPASGQRDQAIPEADTVNDAAVAAYRLSAQAGNQLSERKLAQMFGRTSRRWARARIAEARRLPSSGPTENPAFTVGARSQ